MITTSDIADILYEKCAEAFGMRVYRRGNIPEGLVKEERVVILPKDQSPETYWRKSFVEVNICVPDIKKGVADIARLQELERKAVLVFKDASGESDSSHYAYSINSISGMNRDEGLGCHYVNVRLLFEILNVMNDETFYWN